MSSEWLNALLGSVLIEISVSLVLLLKDRFTGICLPFRLHLGPAFQF